MKRRCNPRSFDGTYLSRNFATLGPVTDSRHLYKRYLWRSGWITRMIKEKRMKSVMTAKKPFKQIQGRVINRIRDNEIFKGKWRRKWQRNPKEKYNLLILVREDSIGCEERCNRCCLQREEGNVWQLIHLKVNNFQNYKINNEISKVSTEKVLRIMN